PMSRECQRSIPGALRGIRMVRGSTFLIPTDHMETLVATNLSLNCSVRLWPLADVPIPAFGLQADRNVSCSFGDCLRFLFTAAIPQPIRQRPPATPAERLKSLLTKT